MLPRWAPCAPRQRTDNRIGGASRLREIEYCCGADTRPSGRTFQLLGDDVAYIKLSSIKIALVPAISIVRRTPKVSSSISATILRNLWCSRWETCWWTRKTPFARFTAGDLSSRYSDPVQQEPPVPGIHSLRDRYHHSA
jgi:hypothetical protein